MPQEEFVTTTVFQCGNQTSHEADEVGKDQPSSDGQCAVTTTSLLHCYDVWFAGQLPWTPKMLYDENDDECDCSVCNSDNEETLRKDRCRVSRERCLFSVVQSSTQVRPGDVWETLRQLHKDN